MITIKERDLKHFMEMEKECRYKEGITIVDAIEAFKGESERIDYSYLKFIEEHKEDSEEVILNEMQLYISDPCKYAKRNKLLSVYLPFILGQWERKASSNDVINLIACCDNMLDTHVGSIIMEEYPRVLYKCFDGNLNYLEEMINRKNVGFRSKCAYLIALSMYYVLDLKDVEGLKEYLHHLLKEQPSLTTCISSIILMLGEDELFIIGEEAVKSDHYDSNMNGNLSEYKASFYYGVHQALSKYIDPFNAIAALKGWSYLVIERPIMPDFTTLYQELMNAREGRKGGSKKKGAVNSEVNGLLFKEEKKIGRNKLCPCGSGKKYKKCCGK